ncbi:MAG TPA: PKD domain-containing protein [Pyrinomonadaceae bacterium]|nr:PKD domain-containing protein [Pyrinomonadaceae bacterium]
MNIVLLTVLCLTLVVITTTIASNPGTSNITVPTSVGQKVVVNWTGSIPPLVNGTSDCSKFAGTPAADQHVSTITVPNGVYNSLNAKFTFQITWPNSDNDEVLTVIKPDGTSFPSSDGGTPSETVVGNNLAGGAYKIVACGFVSGPDPQPYSGTLTIETLSNATPPPASPTPTPVPTPVVPGVPRYYNYAAGPSLGESAGEPTLGYNPNTKRAMYIAGLQTLQVTFPENIQPLGSIPEAGPADWKDVSYLTTKTRSLDPILFTDQGTGRTFVSQLNDIYQVYQATGNGLTLIGINSLMAYTDDDGASWTPAQLNPPDGSYDHQTVGGGPYPAALSALANPVNKGSAVYYCAQAGLTAFCSRSDDGGLNFGKAVPLYASVSVNGSTACGGIHGHVKVAPDGTVYVPNYNCGGKQGLIVSTDAGTTWTIRQVTGSLPPVAGILDPSVAISKDAPEAGGTSNTIYFSYVGKQPGTIPASEANDNHVYVTASKDRGLTWSTPVDVGTSVGVKNAVFPSAVAGDANRAAVAFIGTSMSGDHEAADFKGTWFGYVAHTYDGGRTWTTVNATPKGPVQRDACIWNGGGNNPCRNLLDFNDATVDDKGRVLFAFADGCIDGCETGGPNSYSAKASIARQSGGRGLFAQYDMPEPVVPKSPYLTGFRDDMASYLTWNPPDNGGSAIAAYNIYRRGGSGVELLIGKASGKATSYNDRSVDSLVNTYTYRITAVNGVGESPSSNPVALVVEPRREATGACSAPGVTAIFDPAGDPSDAQPAHDITSVSMAEPEDLPGKLVFTLKVADLKTVPPGWRWAVRFGVSKSGIQQSPPTDVTGAASEDYFVSMVTSDGAAPAFTWGVTSVPQGASRVFTTKGSLDGSKFEANGAITLVISKSLINNPGPGDLINNMAGSVRATVPSALPGTGGTNETIPDSTGGGMYTLRSATLCLPNTAPVAMITADTDHGVMPLTVNFNGGGSYDADSIDSIASYTFNFGDGGDDVTQNSPAISHTFMEEGEYITRLVVTDSRGKVSSNTALFHIEVQDANPSPTPTPTPQPPSCLEDDSADVAYSNGWHLINSANASGGHFRYHQGNSSTHFAALDFNVPSGNTGSITYSFAKSTKGGTADLYLDGVFKQTVNFVGSAGTTQAPEFKPEYSLQFGALPSGAHRIELKNLSGVVYVDAFCLQNSVSGAQPTSGPGATTNQSSSVSAGQTSTSGFTMPAGAQEISVVAASSLNVPYKLVLVNPSGVALQTVDASNGVAVLNSTVTQSGTYLIKVVNVSLGPLQFTVTATPLVSR